MSEKTIAHDPERSRYELRLEDRVVGVADYVRQGDELSFTHTGVQPDHRGQGLAAELVEFALRDAQEGGLKVLRTAGTSVTTSPGTPSTWSSSRPRAAAASASTASRSRQPLGPRGRLPRRLLRRLDLARRLQPGNGSDWPPRR